MAFSSNPLIGLPSQTVTGPAFGPSAVLSAGSINITGTANSTINAQSTGAIAIGNALNSVFIGAQSSASSAVSIQPGTGSNVTNIGATPGYSGTITIGNASSTTVFPSTTASGTWTGPSTTASQTITFIKIGQIVFAKLPAVAQVASTVATFGLWGGTIPAGYRPPANTSLYIPNVYNNSAITAGLVTITSAGVINILQGVPSGNFTAAGNWSPAANDYTVSWSTV